MEWNDDLSLGIESLDTENKKLICKLNGLASAIREQVCKYAITHIIAFLEQYALLHFLEEETYMVAHNFPGYRQHKEEHDKFALEIFVLKKELDNLDPDEKHASYYLSVETNRLLVDWARDHISGRDRSFGDYLKSRAVACLF